MAYKFKNIVKTKLNIYMYVYVRVHIYIYIQIYINDLEHLSFNLLVFQIV